MAETLLKSVRIRERWGDINLYNVDGSPEYKWIGRGFDTKISVFKSGLTGKKRIVRAFDEGGSERGSGEPQKGDRYSSKTLKFWNPIEYNLDDQLDWGHGEYGDNAFIFQYITTQAAILKREKYYDGTAWQPSSYTNAELPDIILAEWISIRVANSGISTELRSPNYFGHSLNESDKIYRKKFGYLPPHFEIIQDPFVEPQDELGKNKLLFRNFGLDRYYLNNGSSILIEWKKNGSTITGQEYSDNWQRELDIYDIEKSDDDNQKIRKKATIYGPNNERFCLSSEITEVYDGYGTEEENKVRKDVGFLMENEVDGVKYESKVWKTDRGSNVSKKIHNGGIYDEEILNEILEKWQQVYGNTKLKLNDNALTATTPTLEFKLPVLATIATGGTGGTGASGGSASLITSSASETGATGATGASASAPKRITGTYIFDVTRKDYLINAELGELLILEKETIEDPFTLPFEESEEDLKISSEYVENEYKGYEEDILEFQEEEVSVEKASTDAAVLDKIESASQTSGTTLTNAPVSIGNWSFDPIPGEFVTNSGKKIKCVVIDGAAVNINIAGAFLDMQTAAAKDGVKISINSGFRSPYDSINASAASGYKNGKKVGKSTASASSQKYLYDGWLAKKPGFNKAAEPGKSNHGNGIALDLSAGGKSSGRFINVNEKVYEWLVKNSWRYGFVRTVAVEEWHFDYRPDVSAKGPYAVLPAKDKGANNTKFYNKNSSGGYWGLDELKV